LFLAQLAADIMAGCCGKRGVIVEKNKSKRVRIYEVLPIVLHGYLAAVAGNPPTSCRLVSLPSEIAWGTTRETPNVYAELGI